MQYGQIERIWFEDDLFSSHSYLSALEDDISPPAQDPSPKGRDEFSRSQTKVGNRESSSAASLSSWLAVNETSTTH